MLAYFPIAVTLPRKRIHSERKGHSMFRVKRFSPVAFFVLIVLSSPLALAQQVKQYTIEQFMNTMRIGGSSFSADEKSILFDTNQTGILDRKSTRLNSSHIP